MNNFKKLIFFIPALSSYLRGTTLFHRKRYVEAISKFEKCSKHPKFRNEQLYSFYGQALCAVGRLAEGYEFLLKACELYEDEEWLFESKFTFDLAKETLRALKHVHKNLAGNLGEEYLQKIPNLRIK